MPRKATRGCATDSNAPTASTSAPAARSARGGGVDVSLAGASSFARSLASGVAGQDVQLKPDDGPDQGAALQLQVDAGVKKWTEFHKKTVFKGWQEGLETLNPGKLHASAVAIVQGWNDLRLMHDDIVELGRRIGGDADKKLAPLKKERENALGQVEISCTLQTWKGGAVLGSWHRYPSGGDDPTAFVIAQEAQAAAAIRAVNRIVGHIRNPWGFEVFGQKFDGMANEQRDDIAATLVGLQTRIEFLWVVDAVNGTEPKFKKDLGEIRNAKEVRKHYKKINEQAYLTRDGRKTFGMPPAALARMQKDVDTLAGHLKSLGAGGPATLILIKTVLAKYGTGAEKEAFAKLADYRSLVDPMLKHGGKMMEKWLDGTKSYKGRRYNKDFDSTMNLGEAAGYIGEEAARQAPGAISHFAGGVFDGLSHLPVIGGVMGDAAEGFHDLGDEAYRATGAWQDGAKYGKGIATGTGMVTSALMQGGAAAEVAAIEGLGAGGAALSYGNSAYKVAKTAYTVDEVIDKVRELESAYHQMKMWWDIAISGIRSIPKIVADLSAGDYRGAAGQVDKALDGVIDAISGRLAGGWTESGKKAKADGDQKHADVKAHRDARKDYQSARDAYVADPNPKTEAAAKAARDKERAAADKRTAEKPKDDLSFGKKARVKINDAGKKAILAIAVAALKGIKSALKSALLEADAQKKQLQANPAAGKKGWEKARATINAKVMAGFESAGKAAAKVAVDQLSKVMGAVLWKICQALARKHPEIKSFEAPMKDALAKVVKEGLKMFDVPKKVEGQFVKLGKFCGDAMLETFGFEGDPTQGERGKSGG